MEVKSKFEPGQSIYYIVLDRMSVGKPYFAFGPRKIDWIKTYIDKEGYDIYYCFSPDSYKDEKTNEIFEHYAFLTKEEAEKYAEEVNKRKI